MTQIKKIAVLYSNLSGYINACLKKVHQKYNIELLVIRIPPTNEAPFSQDQFSWIQNLYDKNKLSLDEIKELLTNFMPDAIYLDGWFDQGYLNVCRTLKKQNILVIAGIDRQWKGSIRQRVGKVTAPWYLHNAIDVLWGAGERQRQLADKLGYNGEKFWSGIYACDWTKFSNVYINRREHKNDKFIYVGRYVEEKGLDILIKAYELYRNNIENPWNLTCVGSGPLEHLLNNQRGILNMGFVQPDKLPVLLSSAGAFVIASRHEPWGVVIQEAATTGLPLICSDECGAVVHLLQDNYNGFTFNTENYRHLSSCMSRMSCMPKKQREEMGRRSHELSKQFTPERWAYTLVDGIRRIYDK